MRCTMSPPCVRKNLDHVSATHSRIGRESVWVILIGRLREADGSDLQFEVLVYSLGLMFTMCDIEEGQLF